VAASNAADTQEESDIARLKEEAEMKLVRFRTLLNKKAVIHSELITSARVLMDLNDQLIANEEEKLKLSAEIDVSTLEILQKKQSSQHLEGNLSGLKKEYKTLKNDISSLDNKAEFLKQRVKDCEDEYDQMYELVMLKELEIEQLEKTAGVKAPQYEL
jgi:chromosome segregation ATPase